MASIRRWLVTDARITMLAMLLSAAILALIHDQIYRAVDGLDPTGMGMLSQAYYLAIGNAFAVCVKAALCSAVATAYAQVLWHDILMKDSWPIKTVDDLSSLTIGFWRLLDIGLARRFPLLVSIAAIYWLLLVSIIFPPGSLTTVLRYEEGGLTTIMDLVRWDDQLLVQMPRQTPNNASHLADDRSIEITPKTALKTIAGYLFLYGGSIPVTDIEVNSTVYLSFTGPVINCRTKLWTQPLDDLIACQNDLSSDLAYVSWLTAPSNGSNGFGLSGNATFTSPSGTTNCGALAPDDGMARFENNVQPLYIAVRGQRASSTESAQWNITTCDLLGSNYTVNISSVNGQQSHTMSTSAPQELKRLDQYLWKYDVPLSATTINNYISNYLAVFAVFAQFATGFVADNGQTGEEVPAIFDSQFYYTDEINAMVQNGLVDSAFAFPQPAHDWSHLPSPGLIAPTLEAFFQNLTVALVTSAQVANGMTQSVEATSWEYVLLYQYNSLNLWLSYGIALLVTSVIVIIGFLKVHAARSTYSVKFSTFIRAFLRLDLGADSFYRTDAGADPLPKHIGRARVSLGPTQPIPLEGPPPLPPRVAKAVNVEAQEIRLTNGVET